MSNFGCFFLIVCVVSGKFFCILLYNLIFVLLKFDVCWICFFVGFYMCIYVLLVGIDFVVIVRLNLMCCVLGRVWLFCLFVYMVVLFVCFEVDFGVMVSW